MATMSVTSSGQDVARRLTDDGYVVVTGMLTPGTAQNARADLDRVLRTTRTGRNSFEGFDTQRIYALFAKTRVFDALAIDPLLLGVLDQVLGHYQLSAPVGICIGPGEKAQILHRDDAIYPVPEPHPPLVVNTMWPLDEFTAENGATRFIPGSHRWEPGRRPGPDDPVDTAVMSPGSALFYLGSLWHGGGANQTTRPRLGVILEYAAGWLRPQENHCLAVPRDIVRDLPERLQELLGYNIYPPFVGYVDGRHPRRVLSTGGLWFAGPMPMTATFRSRLVSREPLYGAWSVIPSPLSVRLLAAAGLDYVVIDLQHGGATEADLPAMTCAIRLAGATPIARVRHAHTADIGRALDLGCEGVIVPNVDSAAQARQVAGAIRYPPAGYRSAGGVLAAGEPFCLVMAESADAVAEVDATLAVDGVDGLYVGPRDLSLSLGCELDPDDPVLNRALQRVWAACTAAGKPAGVHAADGAIARRYREAGCTLITTAVDAAAITRDTAAQLGLARA